jgi:hypothetical protein
VNLIRPERLSNNELGDIVHLDPNHNSMHKVSKMEAQKLANRNLPPLKLNYDHQKIKHNQKTRMAKESGGPGTLPCSLGICGRAHLFTIK